MPFRPKTYVVAVLTLLTSACSHELPTSMITVGPSDNIQAALDALQPGDTLKLLPGIYDGPFTVSVKGTNHLPIVIMSESIASDRKAVIDGGAKNPGMGLDNHWLQFKDASWVEVHHLQFQNGWTDPIPVENSSYLSFKNCDFMGGRRVIRARDAGTHHLLIENCFWDQGGQYLWNVDEWEGENAWESLHHGALVFFNGSLFAAEGTSGGHVLRGNTIQNAFNAIRWRALQGTDKNIEIYENTIQYIRDNDFEPEDYAANLFIHHNWSHNVHKTLSIDHVNGGGIYYFGNVITTTLDNRASAIATGYHKIYGNEDQKLSDTLYMFNNSFYGTGRIHGSIGDRTMINVVHKNNAYELTQRKWELDQWNESLVYDFDCSNKPFSTFLTDNGQEANGLVTSPGFVDALNQDLRLRDGSPCVDAGTHLSISGLSWQQSFVGDAPDIGAFDGNEPIVGPFFRVLDSTVPEHPRITQVRTDGDATYLSFSIPIESSSIADNLMLANKPIIGPPIADFEMQDRDHTIVFANPIEDLGGYLVTEGLEGQNGQEATNWANASDFRSRVADDLAIVLLHSSEGGSISVNGARQILKKGAQIELTAESKPGYRFVGWEGDLTGKEASMSIIIDKSMWVIAKFER